MLNTNNEEERHLAINNFKDKVLVTNVELLELVYELKNYNNDINGKNLKFLLKNLIRMEELGVPLVIKKLNNGWFTVVENKYIKLELFGNRNIYDPDTIREYKSITLKG